MGQARLFASELTAPLETIKDQSPQKARLIAAGLVIGHPLYYWLWTSVQPQPYESAAWRAAASILGLIALFHSVRAGPDDPRTAFWFGIASALGTVVLASWFYVANGGNAVWLSSLCALMVLFFTVTDWRFALLVTLLSLGFAALIVPWLHVGVWSSQIASPAFDITAWLIIGFSIFTSVLTRYTDVSMRGVRLRGQMRALAVTAHEIRTPIAGMLLLSEALEERLADIARTGHAGKVHEAMVLACKLVSTCRDANDLVATHLANANPVRPFAHRSPVALAPIARDAIESVNRASGSRRPRIELHVAQDFVTMADGIVLRQVLVNLLNNALHAVVLRHRVTAAGRIRVGVEMREAGRVTVADDGIGIAKSSMSKIFQAFYTGDPDRGHGLGLTFVDAVAKAYGARVLVESVEGSGTSITLEFRDATPA
jgi:two-component system CAI-1 autoinducer sensor kinase/phosphatase CqsS